MDTKFEAGINIAIKIPKSKIVAATRVGVAYAMDDALLPYRFYIRDNIFVSRGKGL